MPRATVVIPTFDHGPLLLYSGRSALAQTVEDIEVFVVGDGATNATREAAARLAAEDERVRFFDNPKGPSRGETHRNAALKEARGEVVCYLSDDDFWLPNHVETMQRLLAEADFASALPFYVDGKGLLRSFVANLALTADRELILSGTNRVPLSGGSHTLEMYRRLPHGWRTTPPGKPTDLHMWQQFLADPGCRAVSSIRPTVLFFPSPMRRDWPDEDRLAEIRRWKSEITDAGRRDRLISDLASVLARDYVADLSRLRKQSEMRRDQVEGLKTALEKKDWRASELRTALERKDRQVSELMAALEVENRRTNELKTALGDKSRLVEELEASLRGVRASKTWRLLNGLDRCRLDLTNRLRERLIRS